VPAASATRTRSSSPRSGPEPPTSRSSPRRPGCSACAARAWTGRPSTAAITPAG
jgi:hypothetical protein